jgi:hypothetical protein
MMDRGQSLIWRIEYVDYRLSGNCRGELMFYARYVAAEEFGRAGGYHGKSQSRGIFGIGLQGHPLHELVRQGSHLHESRSKHL